LANFRDAFAHFRFQVIGQLAEGDKVATWGYFKGVHTGEFHGLQATHKEVRWLGIAIDRIEDRKVVEMWHEMDVWGLVQQIRSEAA
jgi:predicted ester cyclase